jgi:AcrR family transcriptional regulator
VSPRTPTAVRLPAADRREQLLDATKALALRSGFHAVSIEAVAREAGITRPIVYGHFRDLPGLLAALVERESARALDQLESFLPVVDAAADPRELLLASLRGYLEAAQAEPDLWRLVLTPPEGAPEILRERIARGRSEVIARLAGSVRSLFAAGAQTPDPELTALMLSSLSDDGVRLLLADPAAYPPERILRHARWFLERLF